MQLIKIENNKVSGRELHEFLEVGQDYTNWMKRMIEYGFVEGLDFNLAKISEVHQEGERKVQRTVHDYIISLEMAKEISMLQRNERGKQARLYFIECERKLREPASRPIYIDRSKEMRNEAMLLNARARQGAVIQKMLDRTDNKVYREALIAHVTNTVIGRDVFPLPASLVGRPRHSLRWFCEKIGRKATWSTQLGKILKQNDIEKIDHVTGEYVENVASNGRQVQTFEWYEDFLMPKIEEIFAEA